MAKKTTTDEPTVQADMPAEAHFLGSDALTGEPGHHGVPVVETGHGQFQNEETDRFFVNDWNGYRSYQCKGCQYNTLDKDAMERHWAQRHTLPVPPPPDVILPQFDRFGNYVPPEAKAGG